MKRLETELGYALTNTKKFKEYLNKEYRSYSNDLKSNLGKYPVSLKCDAWTSSNGDNYLGVSARWTDDTYSTNVNVISLDFLSRETSIVIADVISEIISKYNISDLI